MPLYTHGRVITRSLGLSLLSLCLFFSFSLTADASATSSVVIGEVSWAGSSRSLADEWIELWNVSDHPVFINGYSLEGAGSELIPLFGVIDAHGALLISNYFASDTKSVLDAIPNVVTNAISLSNEKLHVRLIDDLGALIDEAGNGGKPFAGSSALKSTMVRSDSSINGINELAWLSASTTRGMDIDVTDLGTPGYCDQFFLSPVDLFPDVTTSTPAEQSPLPDENNTSTKLFIEMASSTQQEVKSTQDVASSTMNFVPQIESTSTQADFTRVTSAPINVEYVTTTQPNDVQVTSTSPVAEETISTSTKKTVVREENQIQPLTKIQLETIYPAPSDGNEWISLSGINTQTNILNWTIEDAQSIIFKFTSTTLLEITETSSTIKKIFLRSSKLNNDGDRVILKNAQRIIVDETSYPALKKDQAWTRSPISHDSWIAWPEIKEVERIVTVTVYTPQSVPIIATNLMETRVEAPKQIKPSATNIKPVSQSLARTISAPQKSTSSSTKIQINPTFASSTNTARSSKTEKISVKSSPNATATPRTTTAKPKMNAKTNNYLSLSIPMVHKQTESIRVRVSGTVGTPPSLLSRKRFILLSPDGIGLLIQGNDRQIAPQIGFAITLTGTLVLNNKTAEIRMMSQDRWQNVSRKESIIPTSINLDDPKENEAWNIISVTGTVVSAQKKNVDVDIDGTRVRIVIASILPYRAERLLPGDIVRIAGVIDTSQEPFALYPRSVSEITLIAHAQKPEQPKSKSSVPPWMPFGAAGATLVAAQGIKQIQKQREKKRLARMLERATENIMK